MKSTVNGNAPFIIGVSGHRKLNEDEKTVSDKVRSCLLYWLKQVGENTPIWVLSGLASGADTIALNVALELQKSLPEGKIKIVGVLPMPMSNFKIDFASNSSELSKFESLVEQLEVNGNELLLLKCSLGPTDYEHAINDKSYGECRNCLYLNQGLFIAKYCNVLLAIWNGQTSEGLGGTGDVALYKLGQDVAWPQTVDGHSLKCTSDFDGQISGIVHYLYTENLNTKTVSEDNVDTRAQELDIKGFSKPKTGVLYSYFNKDMDKDSVLSNFISLEFKQLIFELKVYNNLKIVSVFSDSESSPNSEFSEIMFRKSDAIALLYQKLYRRQKVIFFALAFIGYCFYEFVGNYTSGNYGLAFSASTLLFLCVCGASIHWAKKTNYKWKYQLSRGVAEGIRIRTFLNAADVPPSSEPLIPRRYRTHLPLINQAILITELEWWRHDFKSNSRNIKKDWIDFQIDFLDERLSEKSTMTTMWFKRPKFALNIMEMWAKRFFFTAIISGGVLLLLNVIQYFSIWDIPPSVNSWVMLIGVQFMLVFTAATALWVELSGYNNTANGYEALRQLYGRASVIMTGGSTPSKKAMLLDLAREAMYEHVTWSRYESENDLKRKG